MSAAIADMTCASDSNSSMCSNSSNACRGWLGWNSRPAAVARRPGISELNRKPAGAGCLLQPGVGPARLVCCLKNRHEEILRLFSQADNQIAVFQIIYADILHTQKNAAKRHIFVAPKKNAKRYLFGRKGPKVPCFCEEVPFSKGSPSTISRDLKVPLRKNWGKSIDFGSTAQQPAVVAVRCLFFRHRCSRNRQRGLDRAAVLANWRPGRRASAGLGDLSMGGKRRGAVGAESALPGSCVRVPGLVAGAGRWQEWRARPFSKNGDRNILLYAGYANTLVVRKTVAERYKRPCAQKNVKNIPFEGKPQKVPCFCEGDTFLKISPSTISREFFIAFAKMRGKASIFVQPPDSRRSSPFMAWDRGMGT
jgi:hypothetical protein